MWKKIQLPLLAYKADEQQLTERQGARLVNAYVDSLGHIRKSFGLVEFCDLGSSKPIQGLYWWNEKAVVIAVSYGEVYAITTNTGHFSKVSGVNILDVNAITRFAHDGSTLAMANGGSIITYTGTGVTGVIVSNAPTDVRNVTWIDGYLLADTTATAGRIHYSSPTDITSFGVTDFFTAQTRPDPIQFIDQKSRIVMVFGTETIDPFWDDGVTPFSVVSGFEVEMGCIAKDSVAEINGNWYWLNNSRQIVRLSKGGLDHISAPIDNEIMNITPVSSARALKVALGGYIFYVLIIPDANKTYAFNTITELWSEWLDWNRDNSGVFERFKGNVATYVSTWDMSLIGDKENGKIYKISDTSFQVDGVNIRTLIRTGFIDHGTSEVKISHGLRFKVRTGTGSLTENPTFELRWREDNSSWSDWVSFPLGNDGDTSYYVSTGPMGRYRTRQYEIQHTNNSDFILMDIDEDVEVEDD